MYKANPSSRIKAGFAFEAATYAFLAKHYGYRTGSMVLLDKNTQQQQQQEEATNYN